MMAELRRERDEAAVTGSCDTPESRTQVGIGRYDEDRVIYRGENYGTGGEEPRTIHIGVDVWVPAGTAVHCVVPGRVHSFAFNDVRLDYGPTLILEHDYKGERFYSLYGHLSKASLERWEVGKSFAVGDVLGWVGPYPENGDWPPHLHLALITNMLGREGNFDGVCRRSEAGKWHILCPNPAPLLGLPESAVRATCVPASPHL